MVIQPASYAPLAQQRPAVASTTSAAQTPAQPADAVDLSNLKGLPSLLNKTGEGMAKLGGWGGALVGGGLGILGQGGLHGGFMMPLLGAFLIGTDCAKARQGSENLKKGGSAIMDAALKGQAITPARGAASAVTIVACVGELAAGFALAGLPGMFIAMPAMLGTAYVMGRAASVADNEALTQAMKSLRP